MYIQNINKTEREREALNLLAQEHTSREIASRLFLSKHTVDSHKKNLKAKLNVKNSAGKVRRGFELGLLRGLSNHASLMLLLLIMMLGSLSVSGQKEIELRTDGIVVPRTTTAAVSNPVEGQLIYDTSINGYMYWEGEFWKELITGSTGGSTEAFERLGTLIRQSSPSSEDDDFIFGRDSLPQDGGIVNDGFFLFDQSSASFLGGFIESEDQPWLETGRGFSSFAYGNNVEASGPNSIAFGSSSIASGSSSIAMGSGNTASGVKSFAFGNNNVASGTLSTAFGEYTLANSTRTTAFGSRTEATGSNSTAFGRNSIANGDNSTAFGHNSIANGRTATAFGRNSIANGEHITAIGQYNDSLVAPDAEVGVDGPLFIIGNGTSLISRNNALVVRQNGQVEFDNYTFPIDDGTSGQVMTTDGSGQLSWTTYADNDSDPSNEIQSLSSNPPFLSLSNGGGSVDLSLYLDNTDDWSNFQGNIYFNTGKVGIGTSFPDAKLEIQHPSSRTSPALTLHHDGSSFVRQAYSNNTSSEEKWFILARPEESLNTADAVFRFFYTDTDGAANWTTDHGINVFDLYGNGNATLAGTLTESSDTRLKKNIAPLSNVLPSLAQINGYRYNWKKETNTDKQIGLIAQEVQAVYPELVKENEEGMLSVSYTKMVPILLEAIKEQQGQIESLRNQLDQLINSISNSESK